MEGNNVEATTSSMSVLTNQRFPLQRARYIHVTDLTSAYNVDNAKLIQELERVKDLNPSDNEKHTFLADGVPTELDTNEKKRLQPPKGGSNMVVLVGKIRVVVDKKRVDGSRVRLAEVEVGDETGLVSLRARDHQIDTLQEISERGGAVVLRNCSLELYQGQHMRLAVTKWGKLTPYPDNVASTPSPPSKINRERNFSLIDLTAVASESPAPGISNPNDHTFNYSADTNRGQHVGGRGNRGGGKKTHQQRQIRHSPPMMPSAMHPHYIDPVSAASQQYQVASGIYDSRFSLPPSHQYFTSPGRRTAHGASLGAQQMMYNNMRRGAQQGGYQPVRSPHEQHQMAPTAPSHMFVGSDSQERQARGAYGSPTSHMHNSSHMNPQAATFDPSLYPTYHAP